MSSREYSEWLAMNRIEPSPYHLQRATLEAVVMLINCWTKKRITVDQFLPRTHAERPRQTLAEMAGSLAAAFGTKLKIIDHTQAL